MSLPIYSKEIIMVRKVKRREFIDRIVVFSAGTLACSACSQGNESATPAGGNKIDENRKTPRDLVLRMLDQKADSYMNLSYHCAQSSYLALAEQFGLKSNEVLKALTPFPGIAERGETCGAVTGVLMIFGLVNGRGEAQLNDWNIYRASLIPSRRFCSLFEQQFGSLMCRDIQKGEFGKCFNLMDPADLKEFREADGTSHCISVVRAAVRIAAEIILDETTELP